MSSPNRNNKQDKPAGGGGGSGGPPPVKKSTVSTTKSSTSSPPVRKPAERRNPPATTTDDNAKRRGSVPAAAPAAAGGHHGPSARPTAAATTGKHPNVASSATPHHPKPGATTHGAHGGHHLGTTGGVGHKPSSTSKPGGTTGHHHPNKPGSTGAGGGAHHPVVPPRPAATGTPAIPPKPAAAIETSSGTPVISPKPAAAAIETSSGTPVIPPPMAGVTGTHDPGSTGVPASATAAAATAKPVVPPGVASHLQEVLKVKDSKDAREKAVDIRNALKVEYEKPTKNFAVLDDLLEAGKVILVKLFSPVDTHVNEGDAILARDILEYGALISVLKNSDAGLDIFESYVRQLKHYYLDLKHVLSTPSESMYEILGMYLMFLLSRNLIANFHVELETFIHPDVNDVLSNVYIKKAVEIEQYFTDGRFNKILALHLATEDDLKKEGLDSMGFKFFIDRIFEYSREIIADVLESSADTISATKAQSKLHIQDTQALVLYCEKRNWEYNIKDGQGEISFKRPNVEGRTLPSMQLAEDALFYAKELDTIV